MESMVVLSMSQQREMTPSMPQKSMKLQTSRACVRSIGIESCKNVVGALGENSWQVTKFNKISNMSCLCFHSHY